MKVAKNRKLTKMGRDDGRFGIYIPVEMYTDKAMPFHHGDLVTIRITQDGLLVQKQQPKKSGKTAE